MRALLLLGLLLLPPWSAARAATEEQVLASFRSARLQRLADDYWALVMKVSPESAFALGVETADPGNVLSDNSYEAAADFATELGLLEKRIKDFEPEAPFLAPRERLTLRQLGILVRNGRHDAKGPPDVLGPVSSPVFYLNARQTYFKGPKGVPEEWAKIALVLEGLPVYLKNARAWVEKGLAAGRKPFRHLVETVAPRQARQAADYYETAVPKRADSELGAKDPLAARVRAAGKAAADATRAYETFLKDTVVAKTTDTFALGEAEVEWQLENIFGLAPDVDLAIAKLDARTKDLDARLQQLERDLARQWHVPVDQVPAKAYAAPKSDAEALALYKKGAERAESFIRKESLFDLPADYEVRIKPAPGPTDAVGAYYQPVRILSQDGGSGTFFVALSKGNRARLAAHPKNSIPGTAAHEAVPGHDLQFRAFRDERDRIPKTRWLSFSSVNMEGWAMYATDLMRRKGYFSKAEEYVQLGVEKGSALLARTELALHAGRVTLDEAVANLSKATGASKQAAFDSMYRFYAMPMQGTSYVLGQLEIEELKRDYLLANPSANDADFHKAFLAAGPVPVSMVRDAILPAPAGAADLLVQSSKSAAESALDRFDAEMLPF